jgi:transmembrane sensor
MSSLRFPVKFQGKYRQVELTGEAYFEVKHDASRPFRVVSGNQVVEVLGTHFDVKNYSDEQTISTSLIEGAVRVTANNASILLKPGQQSANAGGRLALTKIPAQNAIAWKEGFFRFKNDRIADIMKTLARWYDIDVDLRDGIGDERFSGQISRNKNIGDVLGVLEQTKAIHFEISGRRIIVKK